MCGSCHTVHLPVLHRGKTIGARYEQATYPEWAFSAYRTGTTPDGALPLGAGAQAAVVPGLPHAEPGRRRHSVPQQDRDHPGILELPAGRAHAAAEDIDLPVREGFARHTLVGLNVFLIKMAQQFPRRARHPHRGSDAERPRHRSR